MLQLSKNTAYELIGRGELVAKKLGRVYIIPASSLNFMLLVLMLICAQLNRQYGCSGPGTQRAFGSTFWVVTMARKSIRVFVVRDTDDAHIAAGAREAKATFLVSYNIRHFEVDRLGQDFQIILLRPGLCLQYLRSL